MLLRVRKPQHGSPLLNWLWNYLDKHEKLFQSLKTSSKMFCMRRELFKCIPTTRRSSVGNILWTLWVLSPLICRPFSFSFSIYVPSLPNFTKLALIRSLIVTMLNISVFSSVTLVICRMKRIKKWYRLRLTFCHATLKSDMYIWQLFGDAYWYWFQLSRYTKRWTFHFLGRPRSVDR